MLTSGFTHFMLCFALYSFVGWLCETVFCSLASRKLVNRGFLYGPWCPVYGFGAGLILLFTGLVPDNPALVFLISLISSTALEYFTGWLLEALFQTRWWDYSGHRFNLKGRVCLRNSLIFGVMGLSVRYLFQPLFDSCIRNILPSVQRGVASVIVALLIFDIIRTLAALSGLEARLKALQAQFSELRRYEKEYDWFDIKDMAGSITRLREICAGDAGNGQAAAILAKLDSIIGRRNGSARILRAFPNLRHRDLALETAALRTAWRAQRKLGRQRLKRAADKLRANKEAAKIELKLAYKGITFSRMVWVFLIACVIGYIIETVFCMVYHGRVESRQGMLYGPFSQIYGFGAVLMVLLLAPLAHKGDGWLFFGSALIGGLFEAGCSLVQEMVFGTISWGYSDQAMNFFGGRTSLLFMFFWGVMGTIYLKYVYPRLASLVDLIDLRPRRFFTWAVVILLSANMLLSGLAVYRWTARQDGQAPQNFIEELLDDRFPDETMSEIYPNMRPVNGDG